MKLQDPLTNAQTMSRSIRRSNIAASDDLGHLRAYELTHGEQVRDLNL
jgi:hypothetical protein